METKTRCAWCEKDDLYRNYHDNEWGKPVYDDATIFEFLILETFQAGLSWYTILAKRENFKQAFDQFDYQKIANYPEEKMLELLVLYKGNINNLINPNPTTVTFTKGDKDGVAPTVQSVTAKGLNKFEIKFSEEVQGLAVGNVYVGGTALTGADTIKQDTTDKRNGHKKDTPMEDASKKDDFWKLPRHKKEDNIPSPIKPSKYRPTPIY